MPNLIALYWRDATIKRAGDTVGFMLLVAAGFHWLAPPESPLPGVDLSFEIAMSKWVPAGALLIVVVALIVLVRRHRWVTAVLTHGIVSKGIIEDVNLYAREARQRETTPAFQRVIIRSYYATIRYTWRGIDKQVCLKLPSSPSVYGAFKGRELDLMILESAPGKPLIRAVYLDRL
jgi:hypothetical protein